MIGIIFQFGTEYIEVRVINNEVVFRTQQTGSMFAPLEGLKLDYNGVCREFPDLETRDDWKEEAIKRFKDKMKTMKSENERVEYIIKDLTKFGYVAKVKQRAGFRPEKI